MYELGRRQWALKWLKILFLQALVQSDFLSHYIQVLYYIMFYKVNIVVAMVLDLYSFRFP